MLVLLYFVYLYFTKSYILMLWKVIFVVVSGHLIKLKYKNSRNSCHNSEVERPEFLLRHHLAHLSFGWLNKWAYLKYS